MINAHTPTQENAIIGHEFGKSLDDLAREQGVTPMDDVRKIFGTWPGAPDDGFEEAIDHNRHGINVNVAAT